MNSLKILMFALFFMAGVLFGYNCFSTTQTPSGADHWKFAKTRQTVESQMIYHTNISWIWTPRESTNFQANVLELQSIDCPSNIISDIVLPSVFRFFRVPPHPHNLEEFHEVRRTLAAANALLKTLNLAPKSEPGDFLLSPQQLYLTKKSIAMIPVVKGEENPANPLRRRAIIGPLTLEQDIYLKSEFEGYGDAIEHMLCGFRLTQPEFYTVVEHMTNSSDAEVARTLYEYLDHARLDQFTNSQTPDRVAAYQLCERFPKYRKQMPELQKIIRNKGNDTYQEYRDKLQNLLDRDAFDYFLNKNPF